MSADVHSTDREAFHRYAREFLRLLALLGVSQADVARALPCTRAFITFVVQGVKILPPQHHRTLRRLLREAVAMQQRQLRTADAQTRQILRDELLPTVIALDGAAQALGFAYVDRVRTLHRVAQAYAEGLQHVACVPAVEEAAWQAVVHVEHTLKSLDEIFGHMKSRNRQLKSILDQQADLDELLDYIVTVYGSEENPAQEEAMAGKSQHKLRRQRRINTAT